MGAVSILTDGESSRSLALPLDEPLRAELSEAKDMMGDGEWGGRGGGGGGGKGEALAPSGFALPPRAPA